MPPVPELELALEPELELELPPVPPGEPPQPTSGAAVTVRSENKQTRETSDRGRSMAPARASGEPGAGRVETWR